MKGENDSLLNGIPPEALSLDNWEKSLETPVLGGLMQGEASSLLANYGGGVKDLDDKGLVGGYLVLFTEHDDPDLDGDFFTKETNYALLDPAQSWMYYEHGYDDFMKTKNMGLAQLEIKDPGVWLEGQLLVRDEYDEMVQELIKEGALGWSSGTASHLVTRKRIGKNWWIDQWPLGLDASFTPRPAEPRTHVIDLKNYATLPLADLLRGGSPEPRGGAIIQPKRDGELSFREMRTVMQDHLTHLQKE